MSEYLKADCIHNSHRKNKRKLVCNITRNKNCKDCSFYQKPPNVPYNEIIIPDSFRRRSSNIL